MEDVCENLHSFLITRHTGKAVVL